MASPGTTPALNPQVGGQSGYHRADIQKLRGIAVLLVVVYHTGTALPAGFVGVDVFFVISGYVITAMLMRQFAVAGRIDIVDFYRRRIRRLLPAAALMVTATVAASVLLQNPGGDQQTTAKTAIGASVMGANLVLARTSGGYFASAAETNPLLHTWSLAVEEQFYLLFPLAMVVALALGAARRWRLVTMMTAITALSLGLALAVTSDIVRLPLFNGVGADTAFYAPMTRAWEFTAGSLGALIAVPRWLSGRALVAARTSGYVLIAGNSLLLGSQPFSVMIVMPAVIGTALLCGIQPTQRTRQPQLVSVDRILQWIGDRSYSWYLWHWPAIVFASVVLTPRPAVLVTAAVLSLVPAVLSYRFVETPLRRRQSTHRFGTAGLATACVVVPVLAAVSLGFGAQRGWGQQWALGSHEVMRRGCDTGQIATERCTWNAEESAGTVMLIGDSQAWSIGNAVIDAAADMGFSTLTGIRNGCPVSGRKWQSSSCGSHTTQLLEALNDIRPDIVIIAQNSLGYVRTVEDVEMWIEDLELLIEALLEHSGAVLIAGVIPQGDGQASSASLLMAPDRPRTLSLLEQPDLRSALIAAERNVADRVDRVEFLDPAASLCVDGMCLTATEEVELYVDGNHLSPAGAQLLVSDVRAALISLRP